MSMSEMNESRRPSPVRLREMSMSDQFEAAFRIILFNPVVLLVLPFIFNLAYAIGMPLAGLTTDKLVRVNADYTLEVIGSFGQFTAFFLLSYAVSLITFIIVVNAVMAALFGTKLTIGQSLSMAATDLPRLAGAAIIYFAAIFLVSTALSLVISALPAAAGGVLLLATFVALVYAWLRLSATIPALVAEQAGPLAAVSRSLTLTKASVPFLMGSYLMLIVASLGATFIFSTVLGIVTIVLPRTAATIIGASVVSTLVSTLATAVMTMIYINLRIKSEGFDRFVAESES